MFGYCSLLALLFGAVIDFFVGDPHALPHPVVIMGSIINFFKRNIRSGT